MSEKKKFNDTKFGKFLKEKIKPVAGDIIEIIGNVSGIDAVEKVGEFLQEKKNESAEYNSLYLEFQKYKLEWELEMHRIDVQSEIDAYKLEVDDRTSARIHEVDLTKSLGHRDWIMASVVITGLILLISVVACLVFIRIPEENQRLADMTFGAVMSIGASIFSYYVGSSKNSQIKDQTIHRAISNAKP